MRVSAIGDSLFKKRAQEFLLYLVAPSLGLVTAPIMARALGPDDRGLYALVVAVCSLALSLGALGQPEVLQDLLRLGQPEKRLSSYWLAAAGAVLASVATALSLTQQPVSALLIMSASVYTCIGIVASMLRSEQLARGRNSDVAWQSAIGAGIRTVIVVLLGYLGCLSLTTATLALQLSAVIAVVLAARGLQRSNRRSVANSMTFTDLIRNASLPSRLSIVRSFKSGLPIVGSNVTTAAILRLDTILLAVLASSRELGYYASAVVISESSGAISTAFKGRLQQALLLHQSTRSIISEVIPMVCIMAAACTAGYILAEPVIGVLYGEAYAPSVPILRILMIAAFSQMILDVAQGMLITLGRRRFVLWNSVLGAVGTVGLLFWLVPQYGGQGAAAASAGVYALVALVAVVGLCRIIGRASHASSRSHDPKGEA